MYPDFGKNAREKGSWVFCAVCFLKPILSVLGKTYTKIAAFLHLVSFLTRRFQEVGYLRKIYNSRSWLEKAPQTLPSFRRSYDIYPPNSYQKGSKTKPFFIWLINKGQSAPRNPAWRNLFFNFTFKRSAK